MQRSDAVMLITAFALGMGAATTKVAAQDPRNALMNISGFCSTTGVIPGAERLSSGQIGERAKACAAYFFGLHICSNYVQAAQAMGRQGNPHGFAVTTKDLDATLFPDNTAFSAFLSSRGAAVNASGISNLDALVRMEQWTGRVRSLINEKGGADKVTVTDVTGLMRTDVFRKICPEAPQF